jgi:hypothetical protein
MRMIRPAAALAAGLAFLGITPAARAQSSDRRITLEARAGLDVPTFGIADAVDAGPGFGVGAGVKVSDKLWLLGDLDVGFHSGAVLGGGFEGPDVKVYHYIAKVGYEVVPGGESPWSVILNAGAGAMTFNPDGPGSNTYPAINVGAKIAYRLSPRASLLLSPQGDIAFAKKDELGTSNAWVWPFTAGVRLEL